MAQFDKFAETYDEGLKEILGVFGKKHEQFAIYKVELLSHLLKNNKIKTILDFGCGTGRSIVYLHEYFPEAEIYGCDVSEDSLKIAKETFSAGHFFVNSQPESLFKLKGKFDLIFVACVFHHISPEERRKWIEAICVALREGGHVAIFEHNTLNPKTRSIILDHRNFVDDINWMLSRKNLFELFEGIDNTTIKLWRSGYTLFFPLRARWITKFEWLLKWCPLGAQHVLIMEKIKK